MAEHPPIDGWEPPGAGARRAILDRSRSIAIVGASSATAEGSAFAGGASSSGGGTLEAPQPI